MNTENATMAVRASNLWRSAGIAALAACLAMGFVKGGAPALADNGGAASSGIITMMGVNPVGEHLYIIDTNQKMLLMYEASPANDLLLVEGRSFDSDLEFVKSQPGRYLKYSGKGYEKDMAAFVAKELNGRKP